MTSNSASDKSPADRIPEHREENPADDTAVQPLIECCPFCGEVYEVAEAPPDYEWYCTSCNEKLTDFEEVERNVAISHKFALLGLLLLVPAFAWTMLTVEQFGARTDAGLVQGIHTLYKNGEYFLACVIGLLSGVFPCLKLIGMVILTSRRFFRVKHHRLIYKMVEFTGKWGMIDVFLAAVMIYGFKFSALFEITPQPGIAAFTAMVVCNLLATWYFDTRIFRRNFHGKH